MLYLTLLLAIPLFGAATLFFVPYQYRHLIRPLAVAFASVTLALAVGLLALYDTGASGLQLVESFHWNPRLGTYYALGLDGFSLPMVLLTALLCLIAILASGGIRNRIKAYYMLMLVLETAILGVFMAQDWALFYLFWEMTLIPLFFLIDRWGGSGRHGAAMNFVLYTLGGSVFILISLLTLFDASPDGSFQMASIAAGAMALSEQQQLLVFLGLLIGFGVKMPIFPIHGWLPLAHVEAPAPVSILLSGILLKMGAYGLIRAAEMLPGVVVTLQPWLMALAFVSLIHGGLLAWWQRDLKRMIAYSSVSHMGVVLLGIAACNVAGLMGAVMQMIAHGLVAGLLFLLIGLLYERTRTRDIDDYSSLVRVMPRFAFFAVLAFVAAIGLPGTAGFIAELHTLIGGFERWGWGVVPLTFGVLISATYAIRTIGRLFTGPLRPAMQNIEDLKSHEFIAAGALAVSIIFIGLFPAPVLNLISASVNQFGTLFADRF
ncbi:MAG: NADH-quinone oxidoreductase subunit M [Magnetococcales bacterium]|nr:NADH-quinone oxidoreductase subunit M [Magnetococcales bacterium]